jgi:hypothetical protein
MESDVGSKQKNKDCTIFVFLFPLYALRCLNGGLFGLKNYGCSNLYKTSKCHPLFQILVFCHMKTKQNMDGKA